MITSNISPTGQEGFDQTTYVKPKFQGVTVGCDPVSLIGSGVSQDFAKEHLFVKASLQISGGLSELGVLTPSEQIVIGNTNRITKQKLYEIFSGMKGLSLIEPIEFTSDFRDGIWTIENEDFDIISMSPDYEECFRDFNEEVLFLYEEYGQEDDDKLTDGAKELKRKILRHVGE